MPPRPNIEQMGEGGAVAVRRWGESGRKLVLSHWSALWYYRLSNAGLLPRPFACEGPSLDGASANLDCLIKKDRDLLSISTTDLASRGIYIEDDVRRALRQMDRSRWPEALSAAVDSPYVIPLPGKLDVLVARGSRRVTAEGVRAHQHGPQLAEGTLRQIGPSLYIVSPELMFVQMSQSLQEPHLVAALATELSGSYSLLPAGMVNCEGVLSRGEDPFDERCYLRGDGYCNALPLTGVDELRKFVACAGRLHGIEAARSGLQASVDHSASPFETAIDVSLALPRRLGGAGCGLPEANKDVPLNDEGKRITGKGKVIADALFTSRTGHRIDVEPGGRVWHSGKDAMVSDNDRRLALERQKIEVIVVPWKTFRDSHAWMHICRRVACHLGRNFHAPSDQMTERWSQVHEDLCDPNLLKRMPEGC